MSEFSRLTQLIAANTFVIRTRPRACAAIEIIMFICFAFSVCFSVSVSVSAYVFCFSISAFCLFVHINTLLIWLCISLDMNLRGFRYLYYSLKCLAG